MYKKNNNNSVGYIYSRNVYNKKRCKFFVVCRNGQALLGMPYIDTLNIININIYSIGTEQAGDCDNCYTSKPTAQREDTKQETNRAEKCYTNADSISKSNSKDKPTVNNQLSNMVDYFIPEPNYDNDKKKSAGITEQLQRDFEDVFNGIGCFDGTFSLQLKLDCKPYQVPLRCVALQKPFEEELKRLQKQDIIVPLGVDETVEWCNSFVLVPKANWKVMLSLDPA